MRKKLTPEEKALKAEAAAIKKAEKEQERLLKEKERFKVITESEVRAITEDNDRNFGWFIMQTHAGKEAAAKRSIENGFITNGVSDRVGLVLMPEKIFSEIRDDKIKKIKRKMYPGYLFIICEREIGDSDDPSKVLRTINEKVYNSVIEASSIHGFSGQEKNQMPRMISRPDIETILRQIPKGEEVEAAYEKDIEAGKEVKLIAGEYNNFTGTIVGISDKEEGLVEVKITILSQEIIAHVPFSNIEGLVEDID